MKKIAKIKNVIQVKEAAKAKKKTKNKGRQNTLEWLGHRVEHVESELAVGAKATEAGGGPGRA